ncbi:MAG: methyltransferase domain-containing protein [Candidatus Coatesbacteria bacterium]|nr:methyltransferase domain-containing protein [Candidatus Coatesbacteria bacterium]
MQPFLLNWFTRYAFVVSQLRERGLAGASILEVGSGSFGLAPFVKHRVIGVDERFDQQRHELLAPVKGRAGHLPFRDASFDVVVSLDVIEHIPGASRSSVIAEMFRLCRSHLIVGCPVGETAKRCDRAFVDWLTNSGKDVPWWVEEHFRTGVPSEEEMAAVIQGLPNARFQVYDNENEAVHTMAIMADHTPEVLEPLTLSLNNHFGEWLDLCRKVNFGDCYRKFFVVQKNE